MNAKENILKLKQINDRLQAAPSSREADLLLEDFVIELFREPLNSRISALKNAGDEKLAALFEKADEVATELSNKLNMIADYVTTIDLNDPVVKQIKTILTDDGAIDRWEADFLFSKAKRILLLLTESARHREFVKRIADIDVYKGDGHFQLLCGNSDPVDDRECNFALRIESITPAYNELRQQRALEFGKMPPWRCLVFLEIFYNEVTYQPPVDGSPINAAYNYDARCKVLASSFSARSEDRLRDYAQEKFAAARIVDRLDHSASVGLIMQSDISFEQVEGKDQYYFKIKNERSKKPFMGNALIVLRIVMSAIEKKHKDTRVYSQLSIKSDEESILVHKREDVLIDKEHRCIWDIINCKDSCLNARIERDFGIVTCIVYENDKLFVNPVNIKKL